jgi:hypothetical protein
MTPPTQTTPPEIEIVSGVAVALRLMAFAVRRAPATPVPAGER